MLEKKALQPFVNNTFSQKLSLLDRLPEHNFLVAASKYSILCLSIPCLCCLSLTWIYDYGRTQHTFLRQQLLASKIRK